MSLHMMGCKSISLAKVDHAVQVPGEQGETIRGAVLFI